jgi:transposase
LGELQVLSRPERFYLGVDIGRRTHTVCVIARSTFEAGDARWQSAPTLKVDVNRAGYQRIAQLLARMSDDPPRQVVAGLEPTGGYYARTAHAFLRGLGLDVHWMKNSAVHDARDAVYGKRTKTDPVDARLIARLLFLREAVGQEYAFSTGFDQIGAYATLRLLVNNRWKIRQAQTRAGNQLTQVLDVLFPEIAECFSEPASSAAAWCLLGQYPTPAAIAAAGHDELYRIVVFEAHAPRKAAVVPKLIEAARNSIGISEGVPDLVAAQTFLISQLQRLNSELSTLDDRIGEMLKLTPEAPILLSFPVVQQTRAATILAAMGVPVSSFPTTKALRRHLGWAVEQERSGTSVHRERLATSGNRHSRRELRLWALGLVNPRSPWTPFRAHYQRLIAPPSLKRPNVALGHLAGKLTSVIYACMSRNEPYDQDKLAKTMGIKVPTAA